jgi:DNA-binding CsgD family transcriptional regulator
LLDTTDVIDGIYEAAVIPEEWPRVLEMVSQRTNAAFGTVFIYREGVHKFVGTPESEQLVSDYIALNQPKLNSRMDRSLALNGHGFMTDHDFITDAEIAEDPFYRDFMHPRGYGWVACTHFPLPNGDMVSVSFERLKGKGPFETITIAALDALRPHLGRSAVLSARLGLERARGMAQALEVLGIPGAVLKPNGSVYVANDGFANLIPHVVEDRRDRAHLTDHGADVLLGEAIAKLGARGAQLDVRSFPVTARQGTPPIIFHLVPVRGVAQDVFSHGLALLIATPVDRGAVPSAEVLQGLFDLTPAEARVARGIGEGRTIEAIALASGVSRETVRTQLGAVLAKTGLNRQAELVGLLSGKGFGEAARD